MNVEPTHGSLSTPSVPPIASTRSFERVRPRPVPSIAVCSAPSRSNGLKTCASLSSAMPLPVSVTMSITRSSETCSSEIVTDPPLAVVLDPVREQVEQHLLQPLLSAWT